MTKKKVILIGANGTIGQAIAKNFHASGQEIIPVSRTSGKFRADMTDRASLRALFRNVGEFDAVVNASGDVAFAPFADLTAEKWALSLDSKLMGQIHLVHEALPFIRDGGSFTLVSGILSHAPIFAGVAATTVNRAIEGFAVAAAVELPRSLRINVISPTVLEESAEAYASFFPGFIPVESRKVAAAYERSVFGAQTGQIFRVGWDRNH